MDCHGTHRTHPPTRIIMRLHHAAPVVAVALAMACSERSAPTALATRPSLDLEMARERFGANESFPVELFGINPCNGEPVAVSGSVHTSWSLTFDEDGSG